MTVYFSHSESECIWYLFNASRARIEREFGDSCVDEISLEDYERLQAQGWKDYGDMNDE